MMIGIIAVIPRFVLSITMVIADCRFNAWKQWKIAHPNCLTSTRVKWSCASTLIIDSNANYHVKYFSN